MVEPAEPAEKVTAAEARFERVRRRAGLWAAAPAGVLIWLSGADSPAQRLAGLMAATAILWISEALPVAVTALVAAAATVILGVATSKDAFAAFGNPLLFLFVGSFFIAEAMKLHGLGERLARALGRVARGRLGILMALSLAGFVMSLWISNTAATAVTLPIALSVARASGDRRFGAAIVLAVAYGASVGGIGTPVGTPPNLIGIRAMRAAHLELGFLRWMSIGLPIGLAMLAVLWAILAVRFGVRPGTPLAARAPERARRPWSRAEAAVASVFALAVTAWVAPGILEVAAPGSAAAAWCKAHLPEEVVALAAAALLFVWPIGTTEGGEPRRALTWAQAAGIDWGTVLLFGGGILLGDLAGKTGLAARWGEALVAATGAQSVWAITALVTGVAILLSEATSNTATATLMVPLALSLAAAAGVPPGPPALGATLGASFGFMLPISTAPNAMAYGTGQVTIRQMASAGVAFDVIGFAVIVGGLRVMCPLLGLV